MGDFCLDRPMLRRVFRQVALMDRMMERVGVDRGAAARDGEGTAWYEARTRCIACCHEKQCRDWLARAPATSHPEPPAFCHNADFLERCRTRPAMRSPAPNPMSMEKAP
jgi:hypothetical protein